MLVIPNFSESAKLILVICLTGFLLFQQALDQTVEVLMRHQATISPFQTFLRLVEHIVGEVVVDILIKHEGICIVVDLIETSEC